MRTNSKFAFSPIAIHAQDLITFWISILSQPKIESYSFSTQSCSFFMASTIHMIDGQEFEMRFTTTSTFGRISTIMLKNFSFHFLPTLFSPFRILASPAISLFSALYQKLFLMRMIPPSTSFIQTRMTNTVMLPKTRRTTVLRSQKDSALTTICHDITRGVNTYILFKS